MKGIIYKWNVGKDKVIIFGDFQEVIIVFLGQ